MWIWLYIVLLFYYSYLLIPAVFCQEEDLINYMSKYMQPQKDPCEDMHSFVCGKDRQFSDTADKQMMQYTQFLTSLGDRVHSLLTNDTNDHSWLKKARVFYNSCVKEEAQMTPEMEPLVKLLSGIYDPALPTPIFIAAFRRLLGFSLIFHVHSSTTISGAIDIEQSESTFMDADIQYNRNKIAEKYWKERAEAVHNFYTDLMKTSEKVFRALNLWPVNMDKVFELDDNITSIMSVPNWNNEGMPSGVLLSHEELQSEYNITWNWKQYMDAWSKTPETGFWRAHARSNDRRNSIEPKSVNYFVKNPIYVQQAVILLHRTDRTLLLQYATLRFMHFMRHNFFVQQIHNMGNDYPASNLLHQSEIHHAFLNTAEASKRNERGETVCREITSDIFASLNLIILDKYFITQKMRSIVSRVTFTIKEQFRKEINRVGNRWGNHQKQWTLRKLQKLKLRVTYPQEQIRDDKLDVLYESLEINSPENYVESVLSYLSFFGSICVTESHSLFSFPYYPFYQHLKNTAAIQPQLLQKPYFDPEWPLWAIYATIGNSIAHEFAHAFDSGGWQLDSVGNYVHQHEQSSNFTTLLHYQQQCLIQHYSFSNYESPFPIGTHLPFPALRTLDENTADLIGANIALKAMRAEIGATSDRGSLKKLLIGGRVYNADQLFFIAMSRSLAYCTYDTKESLLTAALVDSHTTGRFRLIGLLTANKLFSNVFQCSPSSKMNPPNVCSVFP